MAATLAWLGTPEFPEHQEVACAVVGAAKISFTIGPARSGGLAIQADEISTRFTFVACRGNDAAAPCRSWITVRAGTDSDHTD